MAIFGDLSDMSTLEVLHMLGPRTGKLLIRPAPDRLYELHLCEGAILSFRDDGLALYDTAALRHSVKTLLELRSGEFEFSQTLLNALHYEVNFARQEIWQIAATLETEAESLNAPDKATRFKLKGGFNPEIQLPEDLHTFMQNAHDHLFLGSSASDLAEILNLPVTQVQMYFQRLRSLGRITPVRAYAATYATYTPPPPAPEARITALRRQPPSQAAPNTPLPAAETPVANPGVRPAPDFRPTESHTVESQPVDSYPVDSRPGASRPVTSRPAPEPRPAPATAHPPLPQPERPKRSFIRRLLSVLSLGGK